MGPRALSRFCRRKALRRPARGPNQARFLVHYLLCLFINTLPNRLRPLDTGNVVNCGVSLSLFCFVLFCCCYCYYFGFSSLQALPFRAAFFLRETFAQPRLAIPSSGKNEVKERRETKKKRNSGQTPPHPEARKGSVPVRFPPSRTGSYCVQVALG